MDLSKRYLVILFVLLMAARLLAQSADPSVEVVLSTDEAQAGDTIYADVVIHNAKNIVGADVGITTDDCLRVIERQPGNYLPVTDEEGGFSPFSELSDHATRFAASITDHARLANGDGVFYRVKMEVTCDNATPEVRVTFAQLAAVADPNSDSPDMFGYSQENGNLSIVGDTVRVQPGAVVAVPVAVPTLVPLAQVTAPAINQNLILLAVLAVLVIAVVGIIVMLLVFRRHRRSL